MYTYEINNTYICFGNANMPPDCEYASGLRTCFQIAKMLPECEYASGLRTCFQNANKLPERRRYDSSSIGLSN